MSTSKPSCFVTKLDLSLTEKFKSDLENQDFVFSKPAYSIFSAKKQGLCVTLYESGKLMVQGKNMQEFIEFYLEPEILNTFTFSHPEIYLDKTPRIGVDESGKGDFFGSLCVVALYADEEKILELHKLGLRDPKTMSDKKVHEKSKFIKKICPHHILRIGPAKYNELYEKFKNLNSLLAWGHATCIKEMVGQTKCTNVIIDQFAKDYVVPKALKQYSLDINLTQKHRAEEDIVVAAAAFLARVTFLDSLETLGKRFDTVLPKGASAQTKKTALSLAKKFGPDILKELSKTHFKTFTEVIDQC